MTTDLFAPDGITWVRVSPRLVVARLVVVGIVLALATSATAVGALVGPRWLWGVVGLWAAFAVWAVWLVPRQVRAFGYAERDEDLLVVRGILVRTMTIVPYGRMQFVDVTAGPLARRLQIATVELHTAATLAEITIPGLPPDDAARLRDHLAARGEARLAGL
jgi:uncharacterized protein